MDGFRSIYMVKMKAFLDLIRWKNLLMVILTMLLMRYSVLEPLVSKIGVILINGNGAEIPMSLQFPWYYFAILVAATVCITDIITLVYVSAAIVLPLLFVLYKLVISSEKKQLHSASSVMKIVMITGILYSVIVKIILTWN